MLPSPRRALSLLAAVCVAGLAHAQAPWPARPIRMIVPLAAGSAVDAAARIVAEKMGRNLGQTIVIENKPGAAGLIGAGEVATVEWGLVVPTEAPQKTVKAQLAKYGALIKANNITAD